jgi:hypothetical protein
MLASDQVSLELQRVVNATHRDPGPPTLSAYVPKFCPLFRISGYECLGGDFLRAVAESVLQLLMEADVEG